MSAKKAADNNLANNEERKDDAENSTIGGDKTADAAKAPGT